MSGARRKRDVPAATVQRFVAWTDSRGVEWTAREIGVNRSRISQLRAGEAPSLALAVKIEDASLGFIRPRDWVRT